MIKKKCFHCDLLFEDKNEFTILINDKLRSMCCPGCFAVSKFIVNNGLGEYYLYRNKPNFTIDENFFKKENDFKIYDKDSSKNRFIKKEKEHLSSIILIIDGITCAACTWLIERHFSKIDGIYKITLNLATGKVFVKFNDKKIKISFLLSEFRKLGYLAYPYTQKQQEVFRDKEYKRELKKIIISGIGMFQVMMLSIGLYLGELHDMQKDFWTFIRWICFLMTCPVLFFSARGILNNSIKNIKSLTFGMDTTVSISFVIAFLASIVNLFLNSGDVYFDSVCMFVFFLLISRFLEMKARHQSGEIIYSLQNLNIDKVTLIGKKKYNEKKEKLISVNDIKIGDLVLVKPGELIPIDGTIFFGNGNVIESMITGESSPVKKKNGDKVFSGTINIDDELIIEATKIKGEFAVDVIINLLEKMGSVKSKINIIANFISGYFILTVLILTSVISIIWLKIGHENVLNITLSMLVVACPCALSLATPVAVTSSINALAKNGFLIAKEHVLEQLNLISDIVFDKTGTLTINSFEIKKIKLNKNISVEYALSIALALEKNSNHPISKAFINLEFSKNIIPFKREDVKNISNNGIEGKINNIVYRIGKFDFIKDWTKNCKKENFIDNGTWLILADKNDIIAWFNLTNPLRKNLNECINFLKKMNIKLHILSGDPSNDVDYVANLLKINNFKKNISTKEKLEYIENLQKKNLKVMMIGDGINDTLAFKKANISVSMGSAADLAKINSDVILLNNDLLNIVIAIKHSKKNKKIIKQNIIWAIFYNIFGLLMAGLDILTPYYSAIGMSISSLIVVFNSLRLKNI